MDRRTFKDETGAGKKLHRLDKDLPEVRRRLESKMREQSPVDDSHDAPPKPIQVSTPATPNAAASTIHPFARPHDLMPTTS